jgi:DnaJ-class molecular chaperone
MTTLYTIFKLPPKCPLEKLHAEYRRLAAQWHPDRNPFQEAKDNMQRLTEAWITLKDRRKRQKYNEELELRGIMCDHCHGYGQQLRRKGWFTEAATECKVCNGLGVRA